jgi:hypothetical protein
MVASVVLLGTLSARADVFAFKDVEGYEKCLQLDHLIEKVTTPTGAQTRVLGPAEIQPRCVEAAVKLLAPGKNTSQMLAFIKATKRLGSWELSLDLVGLSAATATPTCNEIALYEVLNRSLSGPKENNLFFTKAKTIVKICLKNATYLKDFLEEQDSGNPHLRAAACEILLEEKLVKACKAARP